MDTVKKKHKKNKKRKLNEDESEDKVDKKAKKLKKSKKKERKEHKSSKKEINIDDTVLKVTNSAFKDNNATKQSNTNNLTTYGVENNTLTNTSVDAEKAENSPFRIVTAKMLIDLPPKAFEDFDQGIYTYMNALIMQYVEEFSGIVLAYENIKLCDTSGYIYEDSPYCHFYVQADFVIWDASKGCKLNDEEFFNAMISDKQLELDKLYQDGEWFNKQTGESLTDKCIEFEVLGDNPAPERENDVPFDMSALLTFGFSNAQSSNKDDNI
ncbi:19618_t:CDS:2 [Racocetra fulgida]|uniref:19618_t:CDS:1 n=1 Tax=Racocetra fulgida TaxID=60492 RepID=A0A9N9DNE5_9GLOM|nr:19618_t:CDS:2 [Racocetra fulgida]